MKHVVIVDDTADPQQRFHYELSQAGFRVSEAVSVEDVVHAAKREPVDLVVLVKRCTGIAGFAGLRQIKDVSNLPVICVSEQQCSADEVMGLELGADDYLSPPVYTDVLAARIKAVLRRRPVPLTTHPGSKTLVVGDMVLNPAEHTVMVGARPVALRRREFQLLQVFLEHPGQVLSIADLLVLVWGSEYSGQPQVVYVTIRWLRQKIELDPKKPCRIVTVPSVGYKLNCDL